MSLSGKWFGRFSRIGDSLRFQTIHRGLCNAVFIDGCRLVWPKGRHAKACSFFSDSTISRFESSGHSQAVHGLEILSSDIPKGPAKGEVLRI
jgi:hypothetical protein